MKILETLSIIAAVTVRIPRAVDQRSEVVAITIPK
jgi:hypothetical protein